MKKLVCIILVLLALLAIGLTARPRHQHGDLTVYGITGVLERYKDVEYVRVGDSVVVYDGERVIRFYNCTIEVANEG